MRVLLFYYLRELKNIRLERIKKTLAVKYTKQKTTYI